MTVPEARSRAGRGGDTPVSRGWPTAADDAPASVDLRTISRTRHACTTTSSALS